jgi:DNA-binding transcriptional LysR family regulator
MQSISLEQWRLFVQIADRGSLTDTAMSRDVAQSAISRQLAALERHCGGKLFDRHAQGVRLNEVGQRLYPQVCDWIRRADELVANARGVLRVPSGTVRVGILESLAGGLVGPLYKSVRQRYPGIQLRVAIGLSGRLTESLGAGQLDLALFSDHGRERVLHGQGLGTMPHLLAAPPGDRLTRAKTVPFESLHEIPLVIPGRPYAFHDVLEHWAQRKRIRLQIVLECDSLSLQKQLVMQEGLYAIMAASALREELQSGKIQAARLANPTLNRRLVLRVNPQEAPSQATQAVQGLLKQLATSRLATPQLRQTASA